MIDLRTQILARQVLDRCDQLATFTEESGRITRPYLCPSAQRAHQAVGEWMRMAGMSVRIDAIGNIVGRFPSRDGAGPVFVIGSHLDTVPDAGRYDGILGVLLGIAAVERLNGERLPFAIDVVGFSEEEGVRYRTSYLGSKALCGQFDPAWLEKIDGQGIRMADAIAAFGLDVRAIEAASYATETLLGYLEAHIEQGPVLEALARPLGVVDAIIGQSRLSLSFVGKAGHAGTQPMDMRRDALVAASEWIVAVERRARATESLRATVGVIAATPGAVNVVPGHVRVSLDVRHASDATRESAVGGLIEEAVAIGRMRGIVVDIERAESHAAAPMDERMTSILIDAATSMGHEPLRMVSGAGHDAAVLASRTPSTMLFVRSPGGISHHPDESVVPGDIEIALGVMVEFLKRLAKEMG